MTLEERADAAIKELRERQERVDFFNRDVIRLISDLCDALGTERNMHAAWRKRAEEAERTLRERSEAVE